MIKGMDTFGNCQKPVFSLGICQHNMYKTTNLRKKLDSILVIEVAREQKWAFDNVNPL